MPSSGGSAKDLDTERRNVEQFWRAKAGVPGASMTSAGAPGSAQKLQEQQLANAKQIAELNAATSRYGIDAPLAFQRERFNQFWPFAQKLMNDPLGSMGGSFAGGGGLFGGAMGPNIDTQDLINPMQTRMLLNAANADVARRNQSEARDMRAKNSGSGFGSDSPAFAELQNARDMGANIAQSENNLQFPLQAQEKNAAYRRSGEGLQSQQYGDLLKALSSAYGAQLGYAGNIQGALLRSLIG